MKEQSSKIENPMRAPRLEKVILSAGATDVDLEKAKKLLEMLTNKKAHKTITRKRIPDFGVRPGLEVGTAVTLRGEEARKILKKLLAVLNNTLKKSQIAPNTFSFGIKEYIEIPDIEYQRDIGIRGFNVTATFSRAGARISRKKIKAAHLPQKQQVTPQEIMMFMEENFRTKVR